MPGRSNSPSNQWLKTLPSTAGRGFDPGWRLKILHVTKVWPKNNKTFRKSHNQKRMELINEEEKQSIKNMYLYINICTCICIKKFLKDK